MRIFVVYASVGSGHFKAAEALYNYLKQNNSKIELKLLDVLESSGYLFRNIYSYGYAFLINYVPWLWAFGFYITYTKPLRPFIKRLNFIINRLNTVRFARLLTQENPDLIISTHFLSSDISAYLKRKRRIDSKVVTVITDFGVHPFWVAGGTDIYVVASDFTKQQLISEGIKQEDIKVLGIPVDSKFLGKFERNIICKKFSVDPEKFTVLIVTGSFGIGPIEKIVGLLHKDVQILVVCAQNKKLFSKLKQKKYPNVSVLGFVDNMEELMAISDIIITKPGGLTISELLIMELVPIFIYPIPGQEAVNVEILEECGIGLTVKDTEDIKDIILDYKRNPGRLKETRENIRRIKKPDTLRGIYSVIC